MQDVSFGRGWTRLIYSNEQDYTFPKWPYFVLQNPSQINLPAPTVAKISCWWRRTGVALHYSDGFSHPAFFCDWSCCPPALPKDKDKPARCHRALALTLEEVKLLASAAMCWVRDLRCQPDVCSGPWWCTQLSQNKMKIETFNRKPTGNLSFLQNLAAALWLQLPKAPFHLVHRLGCHRFSKWIIATDVLVVFGRFSAYSIIWP